MHIINLLSIRPGESGGVEFYAHNLLTEIVRQKVNDKFIILICSDFKSIVAHEFQEIKVPFPAKNYLFRLAFENIYMPIYLLFNRSIQSVISVNYNNPFFAPPRTKLINIIHDIQPLDLKENFHWSKRVYLKIAFYFALKFSSATVTPTQYTKKMLSKYFNIRNSRIFVNPNLIDINRFEQSSYNKNFFDQYSKTPVEFFFCISGLYKHKNLETLMKAFNAFLISGSETSDKANTYLVIAGVNGGDKNNLFNIHEKLEFRDNIIFLGFIDDADLGYLYNNCKAFVFPSIYEGFGMPLIEAMMVGAPVICTKETCIPEVTQNKAFYIQDPFNLEEWKNSFSLDLPRKKYSFVEYSPKEVLKGMFSILDQL